MTTRTATRAASAAALALGAMLALSACGGDDTAAAGDNDGGGGDPTATLEESLFISIDDGENVLTLHGDEIAEVTYVGETCEQFKDFIETAQSTGFDPEQEAEKVDGRLTGSNFVSLKQGRLNEANTTIMWGEDSGARSNETNPFLVDVPDVGMVSITDTGNGENTAYAGASTEQGQQLLDEWTTGQCG
ncbi:hypothetical protein GMA10_01310 [Kocuria koreensis]|uniref:Uncharacterized protein n=1 Tax=Rothia koreensis TaxID=592378 RepID=A0A7K1LFB5_9MICC|nr:hypothetical protein [Rothia koreensis]MUN53876.1 hypothetical protein [Rothia koreensis]